MPEYGQNGRNVHRKAGAHSHAPPAVSTFFPWVKPGTFPPSQAYTHPAPSVPLISLTLPEGRR